MHLQEFPLVPVYCHGLSGTIPIWYDVKFYIMMRLHMNIYAKLSQLYCFSHGILLHSGLVN